MKFKKFIPILVLAVLALSYFTKPGKDDFMRYIGPIADESGATPVVSFEDKVLYTQATVFFVMPTARPKESTGNTATGSKEDYIGAFNKFWKQ